MQGRRQTCIVSKQSDAQQHQPIPQSSTTIVSQSKRSNSRRFTVNTSSQGISSKLQHLNNMSQAKIQSQVFEQPNEMHLVVGQKTNPGSQYYNLSKFRAQNENS